MERLLTEQRQQMAVYAAAAALLLLILQRMPFVGRLVRFAVSFGLLTLCLFLLLLQAPYEPTLSRITDRLGLNSQEVGGEARIPMLATATSWRT